MAALRDGSHTEYQQRVDGHFNAAAREWREMYERDDLLAAVHQRRMQTTLDWIDQLDLPSAARVLEVGCGAGVTAVALARRGMEIDATDQARAMIELTHQRAREHGVQARLSVALADAHRLPFADDTFDLVLALGVISFLHSPSVALGEMQRVLRPGGYLVVHAGNRLRLSYLVDPLFTPALAPLRHVVRTVVERLGLRWPPAFLREKEAGAAPAINLYSACEFNHLIEDAGFEGLADRSLGFGPFTFFGVVAIPERLGVRLDRALQQLADRGNRVLRATAMQHMRLATAKPSVLRPRP